MRLMLKDDTNTLTLVKEEITQAEILMAHQLFTGSVKPLVGEIYVKEEVPKATAEEALQQLRDTVFTRHRELRETKEEPVLINSRPRAVDLLNSERTLKEPIESAARIKRENVKVYVYCPECGREGDQQTYRGNRYTKCLGCEKKLFLQPAGESWGDVDEDGYEYHAVKEYFEKEVTHG